MELYAGIDLHSRNTFVFLLGCDPDSRKNFDKAVALSPDNGFNFYNRGSVYLSMEKYTEALTPPPGHRVYASERNSWPCLLVQSEVGDIDKGKSPVDRRVTYTYSISTSILFKVGS